MAKRAFLNDADGVPTSARDISDTGSTSVTDTVKRGSFTKKVSLISLDKTTTGRGTPITVGLNQSLRFEIWGTGTFSVQIEAVGDSGLERAIPVWDISKKTFVDNNTITTAGFYEVDIQGFTSVKSNVTAVTGKVNGSGVVIA